MRICLAAVVVLASISTACSTRYGASSLQPPEPGYVPVSATPEAAWDAAVDFLVDNGINFDFISQDMRLAKISAVLTEGPISRDRQILVRNPEASTYADCGTRNNEPRAGWGRLVADIAVRVRADGNETLVKVVVPRIIQEELGTVTARCVSTGAFERLAIEGIRQRLTPIVR